MANKETRFTPAKSEDLQAPFSFCYEETSSIMGSQRGLRNPPIVNSVPCQYNTQVKNLKTKKKATASEFRARIMN